MKDRLLAMTLAWMACGSGLGMTSCPAACSQTESERMERPAGAEAVVTAAGLTTEEAKQFNELINRIGGLARAEKRLEREVPDTVERENAQAYNRQVMRESEVKLFAMGPKAIPALIQTLNRSEKPVTDIAVRIIANFRGQSIGCILSAVSDQTLVEKAKPLAAQVIRQLGQDGEAPLKAALKGTSDGHKLAALQLLTQLLHPTYQHYSPGYYRSESEYIVPASLIPAICAALSDKSDAVRRAAAETLARIGPRNTLVVQSLSRAVRSEPDAVVRRACVSALGEIGANQSTEGATKTCEVLEFALLHDEYEGTRIAAAKSLAKLLNTTASVKALVGGLKDPVQQVKLACFEALKTFGPLAAPAVPNLVQCLDTVSAREIQETIKVLARIGPAAAPAVPAMIKAADGRTDYVMRTAVADACRTIGGAASPAVPLLVEMLNDSNRAVRYAAADALGAIGPPALTAVPALTDIAKLDTALKRRAETAISRIKGLPVEPASAYPVMPTQHWPGPHDEDGAPILQGATAGTPAPVLQGATPGTPAPVLQGATAGTPVPVLQGATAGTPVPVLQGATAGTSTPTAGGSSGAGSSVNRAAPSTDVFHVP